MKLIIFFIVFSVIPFSYGLASDVGEDESNVNCTKSVHAARTDMATIKEKPKEIEKIRTEPSSDIEKETIQK